MLSRKQDRRPGWHLGGLAGGHGSGHGIVAAPQEAEPQPQQRLLGGLHHHPPHLRPPHTARRQGMQPLSTGAVALQGC